MTSSREWRAILVCLLAVVWTTTAASVRVWARDDRELVERWSSQKADKEKDKNPSSASARDDGEPHKKKKKKKKHKDQDNDGETSQTSAADTGRENAGDAEDAGGAEETGGKAPKHPSVTIGRDIRLELAMRIEGDLRGATPTIGREGAALEWQDRRFSIRGTAFKKVTFEVSRELTHDFEGIHDLGEKTAWKDVYANYRVSKALNFEVGRFKLPFGREELTGETNLDFTYRSLAARVLSPGRDNGAMVHGRLYKRRLEYQFGYFMRDGDNGRTSQTEGGQAAFAGRVASMPFATMSMPALAGLQVGVAYENSRLDNRLGLRGRTVLGDGIFFDRVYVNGRRSRVGVEAMWTYGPFSASTEYITVSDQRKGMDIDGGDLSNVGEHGWYIAGTAALTGERKHGRLEPTRDVFRGGFGAVELVARVEKLTFDTIEYPGAEYNFPTASTLIGDSDHVTTLGINWYLNHYLKIMGDVILESVDDPVRSPAPTADGKFRSVVVRFQFRM